MECDGKPEKVFHLWITEIIFSNSFWWCAEVLMAIGTGKQMMCAHTHLICPQIAERQKKDTGREKKRAKSN